MGKTLSYAVNGIATYMKKGKIAKIVDFALNFVSLGSITACLIQLADSEKPKKKGFAGILEDSIGEFVYIP